MKSNNYNSIQFCLLLFTFSLFAFAPLAAKGKVKLTILHTNDTHSQVEPLDKTDSKSPDMGGYARRMGVIKQIREQEKNVLLFDAGDYWQGTPFFNFYNGRVEIDALNRMKYDAATLGNHEFDNGVDTMAAVLSEARFPILSSNYTFENESLKKLIKPYLIIQRAGLKIGVLALNVNPEGLILQNYYKGVTYHDPVEEAVKMSEFLKKQEKCDLVICLSHLGADPAKSEVTDYDIARSTRYIDIIIGGHSHQLIDNTTEKNLDNKDVIIAQMAKSGLYLGRIDLEFEKKTTNP